MLLNELVNLQKQLRLKILDLYFSANAGHIGCSLSCIDLLIGSLIAHKKEEDKFILSKGHAAVALYVCLNHLGEISDDELETFYKDGTKLPAHPAPNSFREILFATGSLGHGFPIAAGVAKAKKISATLPSPTEKGGAGFVYVLLSDGETNEGTTWEAAHFAVKHKLDNLIIIIDKNKIQGFGNTSEILGDSAATEKWIAIGFDVTEIDGHNIEEIVSVIEKLKNEKAGKPKAIIANTVKGKGVSFMENKMEWHYMSMSEAQYFQAKEDIMQKYSE